MGRIVEVGTGGGEMGHGQQGAVGGGVGMVWDVHAAKGPSGGVLVVVVVAVAVGAHVVAVDDVAVGEDVGEHALVAELAVALGVMSASGACGGWQRRGGRVPL